MCYIYFKPSKSHVYNIHQIKALVLLLTTPRYYSKSKSSYRLGDQFLLILLPFTDFSINLCLNNCLKPGVRFVPEEDLQSL